MINIAIYLRVSQTDRDKYRDVSNSIVNQKNIIDTYVEKNFTDYKCEYYIDDGYTGMNYDRPEFKKMCLYALNGMVDIIIVKDLSRLGREYIETGMYIRDIWPSMGIRFIAINDDYDSSNASISQKHLIMPIKSFINECYSQDISSKVRSNQKAMRLEGKYVGAYVSYGYRKCTYDNNRIEIDKEVKDNVQNIFRKYVSGYSIKQIKEYLDTHNVLTPYEYKKTWKPAYYSGFVSNNKGWSYATIRRMLEDEIYIGNLVQGKRSNINYKIKKCVKQSKDKWIRVYNNHAPIISKKEFYAAKRRLRVDNKASLKVHILSSRLVCGRCNNIMVRRTGKNKVAYICSEYNRNRSCIMNKVYESEIEEILRYVMFILDGIDYREYTGKGDKGKENIEKEWTKVRQYIYMLNTSIAKIIIDICDKKENVYKTIMTIRVIESDE